MHEHRQYRHTHASSERRLVMMFRNPEMAARYNYARMVNSQNPAAFDLRYQALYMEQSQLHRSVGQRAQTRWQAMAAGPLTAMSPVRGDIMATPENPLAYDGPTINQPWGTRARLRARGRVQAQNFSPYLRPTRYTMADFNGGPVMPGYAPGYARGGGPAYTMGDFGRPGGGVRTGTRYTAISTGREGFTQSVDYGYDDSAFRQINFTPGNRARMDQLLRTGSRMNALLETISRGGPEAETALTELSRFFRDGSRYLSGADKAILDSILPDLYLRGRGVIYGWNASRQQFEVVNISEAQAEARTLQALGRIDKLTGGEMAKKGREQIVTFEKQIKDLEASSTSIRSSIAQDETSLQKLQNDLAAEVKSSAPAVKDAEQGVEKARQAVVVARQARKKAAQDFATAGAKLEADFKGLGLAPTVGQVQDFKDSMAKLRTLFEATDKELNANLDVAEAQQKLAMTHLQSVQKGQTERTAALKKAAADISRRRQELQSMESRVQNLRKLAQSLRSSLNINN